VLNIVVVCILMTLERGSALFILQQQKLGGCCCLNYLLCDGALRNKNRYLCANAKLHSLKNSFRHLNELQLWSWVVLEAQTPSNKVIKRRQL